MENLNIDVWTRWSEENGDHVWRHYDLETDAEIIALVTNTTDQPAIPVKSVHGDSALGLILHSVAIQAPQDIPMHFTIFGKCQASEIKFHCSPDGEPCSFRNQGETTNLNLNANEKLSGLLTVEVDRDALQKAKKCHIEGNIRVAYLEGPQGKHGQTTKMEKKYIIKIGQAANEP